MPFSDFRTNASWQAAIDLGPGLVRLAEELPASEQLGLAFQIQQTMIELPAAIAYDLANDARDTRIPVALRLVAALDLVDRIYPALDTADIRKSADALVRRIMTDEHAEADGSGRPAAPSAPAPVHPAPATHIPVTTDSDAPPPHAPAAPSVIIAPAPAAQAETQDDHVHPDSSQQTQ